MPVTPPDDEDLDDDGGIVGWETGDADTQLVPDGGVNLDDNTLAAFGRVVLIIGMVLLVVFMIWQYTGGPGR